MAGRFWLVDAGKAANVSQSLMSDAHTRSSELFLKKKEDFDRVKREGKRCQASLFSVMFCLSPTEETRIGIVVGRRFGNAVARNRGKRIFRELVRESDNLLVRGYDIIIFPKQPVLTKSYRTLSDSWVQFLTREGLLSSTDSLPGVK